MSWIAQTLDKSDADTTWKGINAGQIAKVVEGRYLTGYASSDGGVIEKAGLWLRVLGGQRKAHASGTTPINRTTNILARHPHSC